MKAEIINDNKLPALYINGKRTLPIIYALSDFPGAESNTFQAYKNIQNFHNAGIDLVEVDINLYLGWHKGLPFDSEPLLAAIQNVIYANENAGIMIRLHMNPPYWWMRDYPEECIVYRTREGEFFGEDNGEPTRLITNDANKKMRVSLASEKWLHDAGESLKAFLEDLNESELANNVFAVQVACGIFGEWHNWGIDISEPMQNKFRRYIKEKYVTNERLSEAYREDVTFDTVRFSPETIQWQGDYKKFSCEANNRKSFDSVRCELASSADAIMHFCKIIKTTAPNLLAGGFYGYYFSLFGVALERGHLLIDEVCKCKDVDFLCGPFSYFNREKENMPLQRGLLESMRLNGKLWITEMDQAPGGTEMMVGGLPELRDASVAMIRRNILQPFMSGHGAWYYDHRVVHPKPSPESRNKTCGSVFIKHGWWDNPELMEEIKKLNDLCVSRFTKGEYKPASDVLIVYDIESLYTFNCLWNVETQIPDVIGKCGASFDMIYFHDMEKAELDRYKCIVFANLVSVTRTQRSLIEKLTENKTVVWMYASGFSDGERLSVENIESTTGFKVSEVTDNYESEGRTKSGKVLNAEGCISDFRISIEDGEPISFYKNSGKVCGSRKWNVWFFALPAVNEEIILKIFESANVHRYFDSYEPVMAGAGVVAIHTISGGVRTLRLQDGKKVTHNIEKETTAVFDIETGERLL